MTLSISHLLALPSEIFKIILAEAVRVRGAKRALRLQLVNRVFADELIEALCTSGVITGCHTSLRKWPLAKSFVEKRLLERTTDAFPVLQMIRKTAEKLFIYDESHRMYEHYALLILQLATGPGSRSVPDLLSKKQTTNHEEKFAYTLLTIAGSAFDIPVSADSVQPLSNTKNPWHDAILADDYTPMAKLLDFLHLPDHVTLSQWRLRRLKMAIEHGTPRFVAYLLQSETSPLKVASEHGGAQLGDDSSRARWMRTPNVENFKIVYAELRLRSSFTLSEKALQVLLNRAAIFGWAQMASYLIELGARVKPLESTSEQGIPLYMTCKRGHPKVVEILLDNGAAASRDALYFAVTHGHILIVKLLLDKNIERRSPSASDCLYQAARKGFMEIVKMLLDAGFDPNEGSETPLEGAIESEHAGIFHLLIKRGAFFSRATAGAKKRAEEAGLESMLLLLQEHERSS